jgi:hypothetical protein
MNQPDNTAPYASFAELRQAHAELLRSLAGSDAPDSEKAVRIEALISRGVVTGRVVEDELARSNAQGILDYWAAELLNVSRIDARTWSPPRLAAFDAAVAAGPAQDSRSATARDNNSSLIIRLGATARLWRESGNEGYLLSGAALTEATAVAGTDTDIAALVEASRRNSDRRQRRTRLFLMGLVLVLGAGLVLLTCFLLMALSDARQARLARDETDSRDLELAVQKQKTGAAQNIAIANAEAAQSRQRLLDAALEELRRNVRDGKLDRAHIHDDEVWTALGDTSSGTAAVIPGLPPDPQQVTATADPTTTAKVAQLALGRVEKLGASDPEVRKSSAEDLVKVIGDDSVPEQARLKVVGSLVDSVAGDKPGGNDNSLYNSLVVLNTVPDTEWKRSGWRSAQGSLRANLDQLERKAAATPGLVGPRTQEQLDALKKRLAAAPAQYKVDLHFAGYQREEVEAISAALKPQGWSVRSEQRLEAAAGKNEVRYGDPADQAAAERLAAALASLPGRRASRTLRIAEIQKGSLEIWISE